MSDFIFYHCGACLQQADEGENIKHTAYCNEHGDNQRQIIKIDRRAYNYLIEYLKTLDKPSEEDKQKVIKPFLDMSRGCGWDIPTDAISKRQFETQLKNYFEEYKTEIIDFAKNTPATINGVKEPFKRNRKAGIMYGAEMDDQGFEGFVNDESGNFERILYDYYPEANYHNA